MSTPRGVPASATIDGNEAVARVAYRLNDVIAIYPITPSSPMAELADRWSQRGNPNLWDGVPQVHEMQAEGGAAGALHGSLQAGALTTTFTASQGLLLMIPNLYKIAGELTPAVVHVAARSVAAQALSIFGDHSDVMAARATGFGMLFAASVQEAHDMALIAQAASLTSRVPFLHVMDGFRTSHEVAKIDLLDESDLRALIDDGAVRAHRARALNPAHPVVRGTAQNPDVFFQARESVNPRYPAAVEAIAAAMDALAERTGRSYHPFDYVGAADAERVAVLMGSACETAEETVRWMRATHGAKVGVLKVRLYRPFDAKRFVDALPATVRTIAALDRTKEPGSAGEPLYQDVLTAVAEHGDERFDARPRVIAGRYGLSSKELTPAMLLGLFEEMTAEQPRNHVTIGIHDDVSHSSLPWDEDLDISSDEVTQAVFWGLGSDGTVGANKNAIAIIGQGTDLHAQGYFVYDSKKAGARTISHLRFGPEPIRSTYLVRRADLVAVHQFGFLDRYDVLANAKPGGRLLLNAPLPHDEVWDALPKEVQDGILEKELELWTVDAYALAREVGLGSRINTVMLSCFFELSDVLPKGEAATRLEQATRASYGKLGEAVVRRNLEAIRRAPEHLARVEVPAAASTERRRPPTVSPDAPDFVTTVTAAMIRGDGDALPVSALPEDGTWPLGTARFEKRNIAQEVPEWDPDICIQCGKCVMVCPHSVIRSKVVDEADLADAPEGFQAVPAKWREFGDDDRYTLQIAVEDCTGCALCVEVCPVKDKSRSGHKAIDMVPQAPLREQGREHWAYFRELPDVNRFDGLAFTNVKNVQLLEPLFEFSGACAGCGETPYVRLVSQLYGDRSVIANATGCSSIYGGNLPTTPWSANRRGFGPAWSNSLFEDNAEFGVGMRFALDAQRDRARALLRAALAGESTALAEAVPPELAEALLETDDADMLDERVLAAQRDRIAELKTALTPVDDSLARDLLSLADTLARTDVWILGGDGWAYDIGYGGLDHVLASGRDVNVLVLDTQVYSNTGGQASKATPVGAVAKFASGGKRTAKKDLGRMAMGYGNVYVAQIAMGANDGQTLKALREAESWAGPSLIIAYSHCIAHGIDMRKGLDQQKAATQSGAWPLWRYDPRRELEGLNPFQLDSRAPKIPLRTYALAENRYRLLHATAPDDAERILDEAQAHVEARWAELERLAEPWPKPGAPSAGPPAPDAKGVTS